MDNVSGEGVGLEARLLRLFLAQGSFAERRLFPAADAKRQMLATDIDVLVSEYGNGFDLTRRHVECKGGKAPPLDRILWLSGVRTLLEAETSYLVMGQVNYEAARFAWNLSVQLMSIKQVAEWEAALGIPQGRWPCRSDFQAFEIARARWVNLGRQRDADESWQLLLEALAFIEVDSWLRFEYRLLNRLFRLLATLSEEFPKMSHDHDRLMCCKYCISALLIRLAQYLLAVCLDVTPVPAADLKAYLAEKLTFGDQDPQYAMSIIHDTVRWVERTLAEKGIALPAEVDAARLFQAPRYAEEFVELIQRFLASSDEATCLPVALEVSQFDDFEGLGDFPRLQAAAAKGDNLAALVKGFVVRVVPVPKALLDGVGAEIRKTYRNSGRRSTSRSQGQPEQLRLRDEG